MILLLFLFLLFPACHPQSLSSCCRIVIIRSTGPGRDFQPTRLGVYKKVNGRLNNRPVYKHVLAESFLFFWDYDGESRWVSGDTPSKGVHGIEAGKEGQGSCVDQLGPTSLKVWDGRDWVLDNDMIIKCIDPVYKRKLAGEVKFESSKAEVPVPGGCCSELRVSSNDFAQEFQPSRMTVYTWDTASKPSMNKYPVYTSKAGEKLYLWDWGKGLGINWFSGSDVQSSNRGIESTDMEKKDDKCPEKINGDKTPFSVFTRSRRLNVFHQESGWRLDEGLRIECWNEKVNQTCCDSLILSSDEGAAYWQPDKMGTYEMFGSFNGRRVYKHTHRQNYVYYWEWGINAGSEWMVGHSPFSSVRGIRSNNMEGLGDRAICVRDVPFVGEWNIHMRDNEWTNDETFNVKCVKREEKQ